MNKTVNNNNVQRGTKNNNKPGFCVACFGILGIGSRMEIYRYLQSKGKTSVTDIVKITKLTQPTVSYHLKEMKKAGILKSEKLGKEVYYSIGDSCPNYNQNCVLAGIEFPESIK